MKTLLSLSLLCLLPFAPASAADLPNLRPHKDQSWDNPLQIRIENGKAYITWGIKNEGKVTASGSKVFKVRFYLDRRSINEAERRFTSLARGQEVEVVDYQIPDSIDDGEHTLEMVIDSGKVVKEGNEKDNSYKISFTVEEEIYAFKLPLPGGSYWTCTASSTTWNHVSKPYSLDFGPSGYGSEIPVYAIHSGTVSDVAQNTDSRGFSLTLRYDKDTDLRTRYLHLNGSPKNSGGTLIKIGDYLSEGDTLGFMGSSRADAKHLHFDFSYKNSFKDSYLDIITIEGVPVRSFKEYQQPYLSTQ